MSTTVVNFKKFARVRNMTGRTGQVVPNQFIIDTNDGTFFQSYDSVIVFLSNKDGGTYLDDHYWDYSNTTRKYRNVFLGEESKITKAKVKSGEYKLADLN